MTKSTSDFWFGTIPVDVLCIYRIGFGMLLFMESGHWLPYSTELFSSEGFHLHFFSYLAPPPFIAALLCLLLVVSSAFVMVGLFTSYAMVLTLILWIFFFSIDQLNGKAISTIVMYVLSFLLFFPCEAKYSVDAMRRDRRGLPPMPATACALPFRLIQLEFVQVYFFSALLKMMNPDWVQGTVMVKILGGSAARELTVIISRKLPMFCFRLMAQGTIVFELLAGFLLFTPWARRWIVLIGITYHLGIQCTLNIGFLGPHFMLAVALLYWEPEETAVISRNLISRMKEVLNTKITRHAQV